jgi:hypothetical protein
LDRSRSRPRNLVKDEDEDEERKWAAYRTREESPRHGRACLRVGFSLKHDGL